ncbi:MAG: DUF3828 domain-containing protein [Bosea sp.]|uniref:DUF3828 domain-containing protein n=1 Tax=Bosea sp. (in: a-proteobacteria) TaxID=1871050 RepID=UPI001AC51DED|nr:DUF3828 domain-containing protein [Bosea sp. (in: a-proteobacteria)]MBN9452440.1 DUF3828 domain-containing protein [Bosea sp. (in: a-proteobacteria)]
MILSSVVAFGLMAAGTGLADDSVPAGPVKEAYAITMRTLAGRGEPPWRPPHRDKLMSRSLAALFARDDLYQDEAGETGHVDADPFINGQDGEVKKLNLDTLPAAAGKATVLANFRSFGKPVVVEFRMLRESGGWRIDDIVNSFEGKAYSIRDALSQPYDCGSFMDKPCKR